MKKSYENSFDKIRVSSPNSSEINNVKYGEHTIIRIKRNIIYFYAHNNIWQEP
ncbi:hypothetical protein [Lysinibacillus sphaericus]|uniref:hypothetical protein n=1 Tax=Lysinibacillus sphaericus TaxID=1421 RepID=UPI0018CF8B9A|nr:hypothetical protein [Lysinibacillus sphaericus]